MTREEIVEVLLSADLPLTYNAFPIGEAPSEPPYIAYYFRGNDDVMADNNNYVDVKTLVVEVYVSPERDFTTEDTMDGVFRSNNMTYSKTEEYINNIDMFRITYEMEVILNE